jgi:hypothetical protein
MELSVMGSANPNQYWTFLHLSSSGKICQSLKTEVESQLKAYLAEHHLDHLTAEPFPDIPLQKDLAFILQDPDAETQHRIFAEQCLRCRISHTIFQATYPLWHKFGKSIYPFFSLIEILRLVLNDTDRQLKPFTPIAPSAPKQFNPLAQKILETYDPKSASLNTWASRLTRHDPDIVRFLLDHGIALISDWALLNECTPTRLERLLIKECGIEGADRDNPRYRADFQKINQSCNLLKQFHITYTKARIEKYASQDSTQSYSIPFVLLILPLLTTNEESENQVSKRVLTLFLINLARIKQFWTITATKEQTKPKRRISVPCEAPTEEQLQAIATPLNQSPQTSKQELLKLAEILRHHYIRSRGGRVSQKEKNYGDTEILERMIYEANEDRSESTNLLGIDLEALTTELSDDPELLENTQKLHEALLTIHQTSFPIALESAVGQAIEQQYKKLATSSHAKTREKAEKYLTALHYTFCEFQNMTAIATQLDMNAQYNVTNMLELKAMRSTVRRLTLQKMLTELKQAMQSFPLQTLEDLDHAIAEIDRWMSAPDDKQIDTSLIDRIAESVDQVLEEEAARSMNSVNPRQHNQFTQAVCKYITSRRIQEGQHSP